MKKRFFIFSAIIALSFLWLWGSDSYAQTSPSNSPWLYFGGGTKAIRTVSNATKVVVGASATSTNANLQVVGTISASSLANSTSACITADDTGVLSLTACGSAPLSPVGGQFAIQTDKGDGTFDGSQSFTWRPDIGLFYIKSPYTSGEVPVMQVQDGSANELVQIKRGSGANGILSLYGYTGTSEERTHLGASEVNWYKDPVVIGDTSVTNLGDLFRVVGRSVFDGDVKLGADGVAHVGVSTEPTQYTMDVHGTVRSDGADTLGGFRYTNTNNQADNGFVLYKADDTTKLGQLSMDSSDNAKLELNDGSGNPKAAIYSIPPDQAQSYISSGGLVLNATAGDPMNYSGL